MTQAPNKLFIKLLLGFWLCSSLIIALIGVLPLLQERHEVNELSPHLSRLLTKVSQKVTDNPKLLESDAFHRWAKRKHHKGRPIRFYLTDDRGNLINGRHGSRSLKRLILKAEEAEHPISYQFKDELLFGPKLFSANGRDYRLYGRLPDYRPKPWFLFFTEHKLLTLGLAILLSGLLCGLLAWHLGRPLQSLRNSANALAEGDLSARVDNKTTKRNDEIGQLASSFNSMAASIEAMVNSQQRLMSDISHELRTPLTRQQLALALLRKQGIETEETKRISYEAEQLDKLIGELLELSRVQLNAQDKKHHLQLAETLGQVLDDAEFEAQQKHKLLDIDIDEAIILPLYPRPLNRAIENLLRNAIRYAKDKVSITAIAENNRVQLIITDDGPGVPEEELEAIFKPFYRPEEARDRQSGGWGLGLAITHAAIKAHNGTIVANNRHPNGLRVKITLPIKSDS